MIDKVFNGSKLCEDMRCYEEYKWFVMIRGLCVEKFVVMRHIILFCRVVNMM